MSRPARELDLAGWASETAACPVTTAQALDVDYLPG